MGGQLVIMEQVKNLYKIFVRKFEERIPLGRPRRRWVDNIRMELNEVGCELDASGSG
jgi:hypothetical protein